MKNQLTKFTQGRYQLKYRGQECLNCTHPLNIGDKYCPNCSQINSTKKLTLKDFFDEFFSSMISYDSRLLKTLSTLILRPGRITRDFIEGKRSRYTNPFRFLLSLAIVYFLLFNYSQNFSEIERLEKTGMNGMLNINTESENIALDFGDGKTKSALFKSINTLELDPKNFNAQDSTVKKNLLSYLTKLDTVSYFGRKALKVEFFMALQTKNKVYTFSDVEKLLNVKSTYGNKQTFNISHSILKAIDQPSSFINSLISKLPFAIFFFLPLFALFIWLVYIRKKYNYTDHLIFSFHIQSLLFILLIISALLHAVFNIETEGIAIVIFCIYLFIAMRNFYEQGRFKTFIKYLFLNTVFFILLSVFSLVFLAGTFFTY